MITSTKNERVVRARRLHRARHRRAAGYALIEGPGPVAAAVAADCRFIDLFVLVDGTDGGRIAEQAGMPATVVDARVLAAVADAAHPRGPVGVIEVPAPSRLGTRPVIVLWGVSDPGNAGTLIRSAAAFGFDVAAVGRSVDLWHPKVVRAAAGGHFATSLVALGPDPLDDLAAAGFETVALVASGGRALATVAPGASVAVLVGSEAHGLPDPAVRGGTLMTIPTGVATESLNAAVAGSIAMYQLAAGRS